MADALISLLLEQLASVVFEHTKKAVTLVLNAEEDVQSFSSKLKTIQAVLEDAEKKQVTEARVRDWLKKLKDVSYEMDDVLDEWNTEILRQQVEEGEDAFLTKKGEDDEALKLGDLGIMDQLQGSLWISRLGNNKDATEIEKAQLGSKEQLSHLEIHFHEKYGYDDEDAVPRKGDEERVQALQPHHNLESLFIGGFHGTTESLYWIKSLHNLRRVDVSDWKFCEVLPPLGALPSLEILNISGMEKVRKVGVELLGREEGILFPKLKHLSFSFMANWEEWEGITKDYSEVSIMPRLCSLRIAFCPKLKALPDLLYKITALRTLKIEACRILEREYGKGVGKEWHNVSHIPNLTINRYPWK